MKLTKKLEAEILDIYNAYWDNYLKGDVESMRTLLDEKYTQVGSAETEVFSNKKDAVRFLYDTIDQVAGKLEMRNRKTKLENQNHSILIHERCDVYVLADDHWIFYSKFRATSVMQKQKGGWKIIHQHSSFPDARTNDGENIATEKISKENLELREAVKRRTLELEHKNKELKIEASLERVRTIAMGMKHREDMLAICKEIAYQLVALDTSVIRNVQTAIFYESRGTYMNYEYYARHDKSMITETKYTNHKIHKSFANKMLKGKGAFFKTHIRGPKVKEWLAYQKTTNVFIDKHLTTASSLNYYWYSLGSVALGTSTYVALNQDELDLFHRFLKVFELAYQRYLDIENAETQAKEAQIEATLERVRTRTMAMHKSEELTDVIHTVTHQLSTLNFQFDSANFIINDDDQDWKIWISSPGVDRVPPMIHIPYLNHKLFNDRKNALKSGKGFLTIALDKKEKNKFFTHLFKNSEARYISKERKSWVINQKGMSLSTVLMKTISLSVINYQERLYTEEENEIIKRFGAVFEQAYIRFLDLQKAEAQTREAQIEAALERVRGRAMSMQHSDELAALVATVFRELNKLDFSLASCIIWIHSPADKINTLWIASEEMNKPARPLQIVPFYQPFFTSVIAAWKSKDPKWIFSLTGAEKKKFERLFFKEYPQLPVALKKPVSENKNIVFSASFNNFGALEIVATEPLTNEKFEILHRFGNVFNTSYARFNDLKKAEAQAREAQIQLAMERVRARSMAMHRSDELSEVVKLVYLELDKLKINNESTDIEIGLIDERTGMASVWAHFYLSDGSISTFDFPFNHFDGPREEFKIWKNTPLEKRNELYFTSEFSGKRWNTFIRQARQIPDLFQIFQPLVEAKINKWVTHNAYFTHGILTLQGTDHYSTEAQEILKRFAKVFEQTYTRFLDLQKAEAQAREAQIEAALERVRAASMAMHNSKLIYEVSQILREQLNILGIDDIESVVIVTYDIPNNKFIGSYVYRDPEDKEGLLRSGQGIYDWDSTERCRLDKQKYYSNETDYTIIADRKILLEWYQYMELVTPNTVDYDENGILKVPDYLHYNYSKFNGGALLLITSEEASAGSKYILKRMASVFEQTYTRFLDLQKAEAQAREAQIESALEKVRSRSLAMHRSDELNQVIAEVFDRLNELKLVFDATGIQLFTEGSKHSVQWIRGKVLAAPVFINYPFDEDAFTHSEVVTDIWKAKESGIDIINHTYSFEEKNKYVEYVSRYNEIPVKKLMLEAPGYTATIIMQKNSALWVDSWYGLTISIEDYNILKRVARVFEQSYVRFLDLQKAEAQAREAHIEAALERVRSKTMAMQKQLELQGVMAKVFEELQHLGFEINACCIIIFNKENFDSEYWFVGFEGSNVPRRFYLPYLNHHYYHAQLDAWRDGSSYNVVQYTGEAKIIIQDWFEKHGFYDGVPEEIKNSMRAWEGWHTSNAYMRHGLLGVAANDPLSDEKAAILQRVTKVFEQTYTRFLDLKIAEEQAREARIETALERVRSRSMGMQKSEELKEVIKIVCQQLTHLKIKLDHAGFVVDYKPKGDWTFWIADEQEIPSKITHPYFESVWANQFNEAKEKGAGFFATHLNFEEKNKFYNELLSYVPGIPEASKEFYLNCPALAVSTVLLDNVGLYIENFSGTPYSEEDNATLMRFGKVFEQTYTRFLDLQKAEAQAREAQIEAALEKVRSRSLAMHKSDELWEVVAVVFEKFQELKFSIDGAAFIATFIEGSKAFNCWLASDQDQAYPTILKLPQYDTPTLNDLWLAKESGFDFYSKTYSIEEKNHWLSYAFEHTDLKIITNEFKSWMLEQPFLTQSFALGKNSLIGIHFHHQKTLSETEVDILKRFSKVFDQAYIRFLDLQKAEAQAREAQIQLSLERVRAKAMAMHHSNELFDLLTVLIDQFDVLGIRPEYAHLSIIDPTTNSFTFRMSGTFQNRILAEQKIDINASPVWKGAFDQWKTGEYYIANAHRFPKEIMPEVWPLFADILHIIPEEMRVKIEDFPDGVYVAEASCKYGFLGYGHSRESTNEEKDILVRFVKEFERSYQRFLELQKAEAQAREAQIEAALERVRARTMAMHKSDELPETSLLLFQQVKELGMTAVQNSIGIVNEEAGFVELSTTVHGNHLLHTLHVPINDPYVMSKAVAAWKENRTSLKLVFEGEELKSYNEHRNSFFEKKVNFSEDLWVVNIIFFSKGWLSFSCDKNIPDETVDLFKRFGTVFQQTYTRFKDLEKAEAQAREAQIELALERVRARTMAMHRSDELAETAQVLFYQIQELGGFPDRISIAVLDENNQFADFWTTDQSGVKITQSFKARLNEPTTIAKVYASWKAKEKTHVLDIRGTELKAWIRFAREEMGIVVKDEAFKDRRVHTSALFSHGWIMVSSHEPQSNETINILERFSSVFNLTYRRFLDLQKAEELAREAQIEVALERVRARAMAMHTSEELKDVSLELRKQMGILGQKNLEVCAIHLYEEDENFFESWGAMRPPGMEDKIYQGTAKFPKSGVRIVDEMMLLYHSGKRDYVIVNEKEKAVEWFDVLKKYSPQSYEALSQAIHGIPVEQLKAYWALSDFSGGSLLLVTFSYPDQNSLILLKRSANVFDLAYRRFKDLQKAEAQAREAQIETALERVRSKSLAMHKSSEIQDVVAVVFAQLKQLGLNFEVVCIATRIENSNNLNYWFGNEQNSYINRFFMPYIDFGPGPDIIDAMDNSEPFISKVYSFEEKNRFWLHAFEYSDFKHIPDERKQYILNSPFLSLSVATVNKILFQLVDYSGKVATAQEAELVKRFARVFEQCYVRFQDLEKAEAQVREAQIEAALERVRSRSMGMQKSEELKDVIKVIYDQLIHLDFKLDNAGFFVDPRASNDYNTWDASTDYPSMMHVPYFDHLINIDYIHHRDHGPELFTKSYSFEVKNSWWTELFNRITGIPDEIRESLFAIMLETRVSSPGLAISRVFMKNIGMYILNFSGTPYSDEDNTILLRFGRVFEQTYTRFNDLKQAEALAIEAIKRASLDRVRAEIASMRTKQDLERITPLIWKELSTLGIPFVRCGVFIMDDENQSIHTFLSTPDGHAIAAFELPYESTANLKEVVTAWRDHKKYSTHWMKKDFSAQAETLVTQGVIADRDQYLNTIPKDGIHLHFVPFLQGMLYTGNTSPIGNDQLDLIQSVADAFSTAYARYEDFNKLEAAKNQVDHTLTELKQTQRQLIQSEKMASLGELTAGIAHEIQNPLNFVNNFSEVSTELINEMKEEVVKGNLEEVKVIANDLVQNLEKIYNHGRRASEIVKGMLQHSRTSSGVKEPTDINVLADEYLRLAYHGLRAKDKSFNAKFETDFDATLPKVNVIPQDIGRVLLNLINNAFYAVTLRHSKGDDSYQPTVWVSTKNLRDSETKLAMGSSPPHKIEISVKDNGNGIPDAIKDKIFQPFFTTKPTGQGTGLGLSLAYDIVKAHGGEIRLNTKENEGTEFTILLPI